MTDRELLELAAKAAGYSVEWIERRVARIGAFKQIQHERRDGFVMAGREWNPLADDGDALRLAVRLGIDIEVNHESKTASTRWLNKKGNPASVTDYLTVYFGDGDPHAATRRAITRAAAEIGKAMP